MEKIIIAIQRLRNCNIDPLKVLSKVREYTIGENENVSKSPNFGLSTRRHNFLVNTYHFALGYWESQASLFQIDADVLKIQIKKKITLQHTNFKFL